MFLTAFKLPKQALGLSFITFPHVLSAIDIPYNRAHMGGLFEKEKEGREGTERVSESGEGQRPVPKYKSGGRDEGGEVGKAHLL